MCSVSTTVVAGVLKVMLSGCAAEERACEARGFIYGTAGYVDCVYALSNHGTFNQKPKTFRKRGDAVAEEPRRR
jgi:hypothetical protein